MKLLLVAALLLPLTGPARADEVSGLLDQARAAAARMPGIPAAPAAVPAPEMGLSGPNVWVFAVGLVEFREAQYNSFPKARRRDSQVAQSFAVHGVPQDHIVFLQDGAATRARVRSSLKGLLSKSQPGDILFFYYSGHGFRDSGELFLVNYDSDFQDPDTSWSEASIIDEIEADFKGSSAILATEACYSGLVAKQAAARAKRVAYGVLSSAEADEESTGEWTFSDELLAGLDGNPYLDEDHDGKITFAELGRGVQAAMAYLDDQGSVVATVGGFDADMKISDARPRAPKTAGAPQKLVAARGPRLGRAPSAGSN